MIRCSGAWSVEAIVSLRHDLQPRDIPVVVERAPVDHLHAVGHFGALRPGVAELTAGLRRTFDPQGIMAVPLTGEKA